MTSSAPRSSTSRPRWRSGSARSRGGGRRAGGGAVGRRRDERGRRGGGGGGGRPARGGGPGARGSAPSAADDVRPGDAPGARVLFRRRELLAPPVPARGGKPPVDAAGLLPAGLAARRRRVAHDR